MTGPDTLDFARESIVLLLQLCAPAMLTALVVGIVIGLLQAVTQIQEQTVSLIPKLLAMTACTVLLLPWMSQHVIEFARQVLSDGMMP